MTRDEIVARAAQVRPRRKREDTEAILAFCESNGTPFCYECWDWHQPTEDHSSAWYGAVPSSVIREDGEWT